MARREDDGSVVAALARVLAARGRRLPAGLRGLLVGLLVLSTVWGFGRAAVPDRASSFLLAGLLGGAVAWLAVGRR